MRWYQEIAKDHFLEILLFAIFVISVVALWSGGKPTLEELTRFVENGNIPGMMVGLYTGKAVQKAITNGTQQTNGTETLPKKENE